ncbi:M24 family metallopeptidase [Actinocorallia sp. API 0066]|uniref:M24 family metallopeptidase n=1 Tax=Actinocorallia sp. API 0066 TaxID=2896846 RepID=UPI0035AB904B
MYVLDTLAFRGAEPSGGCHVRPSPVLLRNPAAATGTEGQIRARTRRPSRRAARIPARFGTTRHWHKRIVRSGPHTLFPYQENPPDRTIQDDDIVFADFGPVFQDFEADLGRTYVLGDDPVKHRLAADLPVIFDAGRRLFAADPAITGARLHAEIDRLARAAGWTLGGEHAGHLIGEFPHNKITTTNLDSYIAPGNTTPLRRTDHLGLTCHWILEIHLTTPTHAFGGFHEQLLDLD